MKKASAVKAPENSVLSNLHKTKDIAAAFFETGAAEPTEEMIIGVHDRVFGDPDIDDDDREAIMGDLAESREEAKKLCKEPSASFVFDVYDRLFTDLLDGEED